MIVYKIETATVFKSLSGRRYFTRRAALKSAAWHLWKQKHRCECSYTDPFEGPPPCPRHSNDNAKEIIQRLVKKWERQHAKNPM